MFFSEIVARELVPNFQNCVAALVSCRLLSSTSTISISYSAGKLVL